MKIRRDESESAIVATLGRMGALVWRINERDLPDLLIGWRGAWLLMEVKLPGGKRGGTAHSKLSPGQERFHFLARAAGLPVHVVRTPEQALAALGMEVRTP